MDYEILAPAGDERSARAALQCGADAVYLGLSRFSARSSAENFGLDSLAKLTTSAHLLGAKVYVCLNTLVKDGEIDDFLRSVEGAWKAGADAVLMQDLFLGKRLKEAFPALTLHLSTQAGCCNERGAGLARECGFSRVVLARETPLSEIRKIAKTVETEVFVQGALCTCFSGQCYLSSFAGNNSGNRGRCKQPCRKKYSIDRAGCEKFSYALSPADLSVGARVKELLDAGVVSLKIEGRMRRPEYVAAAVLYYRALLEGGDAAGALSDLKRAYNRGDYTEGLAFGQKEGFLSRKVQGHIGERVGCLQGENFCKSDYSARKGDGFKILRGGEEVGGAVFRESGKGGFYLSSSATLLRGDEVRLTTDVSLPQRLARERKRTIALSLRFVAGEPSRMAFGDLCRTGDVLQEAKSAPLSEEELKECFRKTDGLPLDVRFAEVETKNAFLPRSALNALRRGFYEDLSARLSPPREDPPHLALAGSAPAGREERKAVIVSELAGSKADILIYRPRDYAKISPEDLCGEGEKFLFLPPFLTSEEEKRLLPVLSFFDGVYCDGYYGLTLAREKRLRFFAGTGWNLTNAVSLAAAREMGAELIALSKELTVAEQNALAGEGVFSLDFGQVKVMDLCYCPFSKDCAHCDRRDFYTVRDEEGRKFPLRRYRTSEGQCRFELFNCAPLRVEKHDTGALFDLTGREKELGGYLGDPARAPLPGANRGHANRSLL